MVSYDIQFQCEQWGERHSTGFKARFVNTDLEGLNYAATHALQTLTPNLDTLLAKDDLQCPTTGQAVPLPTFDDLFLGSFGESEW
jgi:hypothetical protein